MPDDLPLEIAVDEAAGLLNAAGENEVLLVDCREPDEHAICRIDGAELIPMRTIPQQAADKLPETGQRIIVYCHHGMRSEQVTRWLRREGWTRAQSLQGGIDAWSCRIDPAVPRY